MSKLRSYFHVAFLTTLNIILYALTYGRFVWLEGRVRGGVFRNWARRFRYRPQRFARPTTEQEIVDLIKNSRSLRFFGSAHSFNEGVVTDETLVSLDAYSGLVWKDLPSRRMAFKAGTRVRDIVDCLLEDNLAFVALPSHDAQSIGGILSTDVHGTGRDWGFVSQSVVSLKLIDGTGRIHECGPSDDLFKAAIGGVGAAWVISEVVVQAVERFNVEQKVYLSDITTVERNLDQLLRDNQHFSLYLFPFTNICQVNTWRSTNDAQSFFGPVREFVSISIDALLAAWFGNFMAYTGLLPALSDGTHRIKRGTNLVLESNKAFNRTIYHLHQELEFTVPFDETFEVCRRFIKLYEEMYDKNLPYTLFEVRFTPPDHDLTLIGAGRGRRSTWLDLVCNDSHGFETYYAEAEKVLKEIGARPHLGKFCRTFTQADLLRLHGPHFQKFQQLVAAHDPQGKFANALTRRLF
ncbi:MAG TPA: D-arabinono-1,4-lactone oxidase [Pyrinomonadaceae bacterium]|jgi:hypothetical protein|nr:D-arabinono-1,4-lactone oxidase [Pyrinomonadaceae bacterium]